MKDKLKKISIIVLTLTFLILLLNNPTISKESINASFNLWLSSIVPSLFPMIIINDILLNYQFSYIICKIFYKPFNKIFKLSFNGTYLFIMSLFIGTPSNAVLAKNLLDNKLIEEKELNKLIYVLYFSNPLFLYNMLYLMFNNKMLIIKIIAIHYISNFIILYIIRNKYISKNKAVIQNKTESLGNIIFKSVKKSINTLLTVLGVISFFILLTNYLPSGTLFKGLLEITTGLNSIINNKNKLYLSIIIINFGGLSIFMQIKSILEDTNINFYNYFKGRILQTILSLILFI